MTTIRYTPLIHAHAHTTKKGKHAHHAIKARCQKGNFLMPRMLMITKKSFHTAKIKKENSS